MRAKFLQSVAIIIGAAIAASIVYYYSSVTKTLPQQYANPIYAVIILVGGYLLIRIISAIIRRVLNPKLGRTKGEGAKNLFQIVAGILLLLSILSLFGSNLTNLLIGAGFVGIVLGLAAQQVLGNLFAGISLLASRPFEIGDRLTLAPNGYGIIANTYSHENMVNGYTGVIDDIGLFYTRMILDEGVPMVLPNSVVIGSLVLNHTKVKRRTVSVRFDLDHRIPFSEFKDRMTLKIDAPENEMMIIKGSLHINILGASLSSYQVGLWVWTESAFEEPVKSLLLKDVIEIQERLLPKNNQGS